MVNKEEVFKERMYGPKTFIGNWFENGRLEEDLLRDFLEKKERGDLMVQRLSKMKAKMSGPPGMITSTSDGLVHFGDVIQLVNPGIPQDEVTEGSPFRAPSVLSVLIPDSMIFSDETITPGSIVSASLTLEPTLKNAFRITSCDSKVKDGEEVRFNEPFQLVSHHMLGPPFYVMSDMVKLTRAAKFSGHQMVFLEESPLFLSKWMVECVNPREAVKLEGSPVPLNTKVIIRHKGTNYPLGIEAKHSIRNFFGKDFEVSCHPHYGDYKALMDSNYWTFVGKSVPLLDKEETD